MEYSFNDKQQKIKRKDGILSYKEIKEEVRKEESDKNKTSTQKFLIIKFDMNLIKISLKYEFKYLYFLLFEKLTSYGLDFFGNFNLYYWGKIIDAITLDKNKSLLIKYSLILVVIILIRYCVFSFLDTYIFYKRKGGIIEMNLLEKISEKDIEFFEKYDSSEIITKIRESDTNAYYGLISRVIDTIMVPVKLIYYLYLLCSFSFKITLILFISYIVDYLFLNIQERINNSDIQYRIEEKYYKMEHKKKHEFISNIRTIKSFAVEQRELSIIEKIRIIRAEPFYSLFSHVVNNISDLKFNLTNVVVLLFAGIETVKGNISYGNFYFCQSLFKNCSFLFGEILYTKQRYIQLFHNMNSFYTFFEYEPKIKSRANLILPDLKGKITFSNVSFSYPTKSDVLILNRISFTIDAGKTVAFVGHSGGGKSTISSLLLRFYDPSDGIIELDGHDLRDLNIAYLRKNIGYVQQEPPVFSGSIEENITYGIKDYYKEEFEEVCRVACIDEFVEDDSLFPEKYQTLVGDKGVKISGGQKQRIAIARALIKKPKILLLDEATSALDAETENKVKKGLDSILSKRKMTTIIIAHRLSTIQDADMIFFIGKGGIIEQGTHRELIEKNGEYRKLVQRQLMEN